MRKLNYLLVSVIVVLSCDRKSSWKVPEIIPEELPGFEVLINSEDAFDGYIFLRKTAAPGAQLMINNYGDVVWFHMSDTILFRPFTPYEESYVALYSDKVIHEITYMGDTLLELKYGEGGFDRLLHHEIIKDSEGAFISLTREFIPIDLSVAGGEQLDTIKTDGIIRLSKSGEKLWHWSIQDVLDPLEYSDINRQKGDWGHANALFIDEDGHYVISWRDFNSVWKINSLSGEVIWKYGLETITDEENQFYQQHGIHRNLDGDYMLFDNGEASKRKSSRALAFTGSSNSFNNTLVIELPDSLFTFKQGSVYQFAEDRYLYSSTMTKQLAITDRTGNLLWLARSNKSGFYRAYYLDKSILE